MCGRAPRIDTAMEVMGIITSRMYRWILDSAWPHVSWRETTAITKSISSEWYIEMVGLMVEQPIFTSGQVMDNLKASDGH